MIQFIINPASGGGQALQIWKGLEKQLIREKVSYKAFVTEKAGDAARFASQLSDGVLAVVGGDGTTNEILSGLKNPKDILLGIIPVGSGNDGARGLSLPRDPLTALKNILHPSKIISVDIGEIFAGGQSRKFLVSSGIGFDASICHKALSSRLKVFLNHFHLGKLTYAGIALKEILFSKPRTLFVTLDDGTEKTFENCWIMAFMNLPSEGGGFYFAPKASPSDGLLDIAIIHDVSRFKLLRLLPSAMKGRHTKAKGADFLSCKAVTVCAKTPLPLHSDGENAGIGREATVTLHPKYLRLISA